MALAGCGGGEEDAAWRVTPLEVSFLETAGMPHLSPSRDGVVLSWWRPVETAPAGEAPGGPPAYALEVAEWRPGQGFGTVTEVVRGRDFFVNWADFPSVVEVAPEKWVAHWLQRNGEGTYAYGVRMAESRDAGGTWTEAWTPHTDGTPTEHGFVSIWPDRDGAGGWSAVWLDGRSPTREMTLRTRHVPAAGTAAADPEVLVDDRICDCCQTDAAWTDRGPVVVYRDRTGSEIRDIYLARLGPEGWTPGHPVHEDGWEIAQCPVNGPAVDARGDTVVVAWFTGAQEDPRVQVAYSVDAGDSFGPAYRVDDGQPLGRVDVLLRDDGSALVSWLEDGAGEGASILLRTVSRQGVFSRAGALAETRRARGSGFPQIVPAGDGRYLAAWTEMQDDGTTRVRTALVEEDGGGR